MSGGRRRHDGRRRRRTGLRPHQHEPGARQVPDQTLGSDARHDFVSTMDAPISVIPEGTGDLGQFVALPPQRRDSIPQAPCPLRRNAILSASSWWDADWPWAAQFCQMTKYRRRRWIRSASAGGGAQPSMARRWWAERQSLYAKARQRDIAEVAYALKDVLAGRVARTVFVAAHRGTTSGDRLRRRLARLLTNDPQAPVFFDDLILLGDGKRPRQLWRPVRP
jgi:hypothetical protein